jgi:hypothetical protein
MILVLTLSARMVGADAFDGRIDVALVQGGQTNTLRHTIGPAHLRIETIGSAWPNPVDIVERQSGVLTLLSPHNRSFVRLKPAANTAPPGMPGFPGMPMAPGGLPAGIGPQTAPSAPGQPGVGVPIPAMPAVPQMPQIPQMPAMPALPQGAGGLPPGVGPQPGGLPAMRRMTMPMVPMMNQKLELKPTGLTTNILGYACRQYELKQRGELMEIWATDQLPPFQPYVRNQPHRFGPHMLQEQWAGLVTDRKVFPMLASLRYDSGAERLRFEVTSISAEKITEPSEELFAPPPDYHEIQPLPF